MIRLVGYELVISNNCFEKSFEIFTKVIFDAPNYSEVFGILLS